jgi:hemoglobin
MPMALETQRRDAVPTVAQHGPSLYERLGGAGAISATVDQFYDRVLRDNELKPFFTGTNLTWLRERQKRFFTQALGGPSVYDGRPMREAHADLRIAQLHFDLVAGHLVDTLVGLGVPQPLVDETVGLVAPLAAEIVNVNTEPANGTRAATT